MKQTFQEFINGEQSVQYMIEEMVSIMDTDIDVLYEMVEEDDYIVLEEGIISAHKGNRSLIKYFKSAGKGLAKLFMSAIKGDAEGIKKVAKSIKMGDVLDFLLRLDTATLHLITGPIHSIEAITGWHLWANIEKVKKGGQAIADKIHSAIQTIKQHLGGLIAGKKKKEYEKYLDTIDKSIADPTSFTSLAMGK